MATDPRMIAAPWLLSEALVPHLHVVAGWCPTLFRIFTLFPSLLNGCAPSRTGYAPLFSLISLSVSLFFDLSVSSVLTPCDCVSCVKPPGVSGTAHVLGSTSPSGHFSFLAVFPFPVDSLFTWPWCMVTQLLFMWHRLIIWLSRVFRLILLYLTFSYIFGVDSHNKHQSAYSQTLVVTDLQCGDLHCFGHWSCPLWRITQVVITPR